MPQFNTIESIERILAINGIDFKTLKHEADIAANKLKSDILSHSADLNKVILSQTKLLTNNEGQYWLACLPQSKKIDLIALSKHLNIESTSNQLSFADERTLKKKTGCSENNANFFSLLNVKKECNVTVLFDKELFQSDDDCWIGAHPMDSSASTLVKKDGLDLILDLAGRSDLSSL